MVIPVISPHGAPVTCALPREPGWFPVIAPVLWPEGRIPISVLLDDCVPCRNPAWYEFPEQGHRADVPNGFVDQFAAMIARTGAAGKFSVVPCPGGQGRIDQELPGVDPDDIAYFVRLVRDKISPRWDVSPELLTHNRAMNLATMQLSDQREDVWAAGQNEATLRDYIAHALRILHNVGLAPNGVTSPWAFGQEVEEAYRSAIATALRLVCGIKSGWYFLHVEPEARHVAPRVVRLDRQHGTSLVSVASGCGHDFAWETQEGRPPDVDLLLSADGLRGRLTTLIAAGSPVTFHTHWQSLFSNGTGAGLTALEEVCTRINRLWGERIRWTSAAELATYATAAQATRVHVHEIEQRLSFSAPVTCRSFTVQLPCLNPPRAISCDGVALSQLPAEAPLVEGCWRRSGSSVVACLDLRDGMELTWQ